MFTVNTKHHRAARVSVGRTVVFVSGRAEPYAEKAVREASRARRTLSAAVGRQVQVTPLVVVHGAAVMRGWIRRRPCGVKVLPSRAATWWLRLRGR